MLNVHVGEDVDDCTMRGGGGEVNKYDILH